MVWEYWILVDYCGCRLGKRAQSILEGCWLDLERTHGNAKAIYIFHSSTQIPPHAVLGEVGGVSTFQAEALLRSDPQEKLKRAGHCQWSSGATGASRVMVSTLSTEAEEATLPLSSGERVYQG